MTSPGPAGPAGVGLVIHAGAMSAPILERCGFQVVGHLQLLVDGGISR